MLKHPFIAKPLNIIFGYGTNKITPTVSTITKEKGGSIVGAPLLKYCHGDVEGFIDGPDESAMLIALSEDNVSNRTPVLAAVVLRPYSTTLEIKVVVPGPSEIKAVKVERIELDDRVFDLLSGEDPEVDLHHLITTGVNAMTGCGHNYTNLDLSEMVSAIKSAQPFVAYCDGTVDLYTLNGNFSVGPWG